MDMDDNDTLEKRAQRHAKAMFQEEKTPTKRDTASTLPEKEMKSGSVHEFESIKEKMTTPKKRQFKPLTPQKSGKKKSTSPTRKGKQPYKHSDNPNVNPESVMVEDQLSWSSDSSEDNDQQLDKSLEKKAKNINLSKRNVKSIIHHLLTNEHVIKLYKDALSAHDMAEAHGDEMQPVAVGSLDSFPKMTRSKVKDFMEKSNIPPSPCKSRRPGPSILDLDFAEEEDDDEYSPDKDENETDDDESVVSSYLSEFGSPCPVTPSTPVLQIHQERPSLNISPASVNSPLTSGTRRLKIDLSACEGLSETEEEENIALRTRSKKSLTDTALVDIEQAFIAPDITPDMYDTFCEDKEWVDFLNTLHKTDESVIDDEVNDPEFNYIAEAEQEAFDDEDFRFDKPTKVSKKELNSLIEELYHLFEDEVLPLQVVAQASSTQDPISQFVNSNMKENPIPTSSDTAQIYPMPSHTPQSFLSQESQRHPQTSSQHPQVISTPSSSHVNNAGCLPSDACFKTPQIPSQTPNLSSKSHASLNYHETQNMELIDQSNGMSYQNRLIQDNIRKHIQLLAQTYVLCKTDGSKDSSTISNTAKELLEDLCHRKSISGSDSIWNVCNLDEAVQVVSKPFVANQANCLTRDEINFKRLQQIELRMTFYDSPAFMYPHLLPNTDQATNRTKKSKSKASNARCKFLPSEDILIALGLEQFSDCQGVFPSELIHKYLIRGKTTNDIYRRIMFLSSSKAGINHVKKFRRLNQPVQLDPPFIHIIDFRGPKHKPPDLLPEWCKELATAQDTSSSANSSNTDISSLNNCDSLVNAKVISIQPRPTPIYRSKDSIDDTNNTHQPPQTKQPSVIPSSVIFKKSKNMSSSRSNHSKKKGTKNQTTELSNSSSQLQPSMERLSVGDKPYPNPSTSHTRKRVECHQSPDLLNKVMTSCGLDCLSDSSSPLSPSSSSTPVHVSKHKPSSVKNLTSAFDESEIVTAKLNEKRKPVDTIDTHSDVSSQKAPLSGISKPSVLSCENIASDNVPSELDNLESPLPTDVSPTTVSSEQTIPGNVQKSSLALQGSSRAEVVTLNLCNYVRPNTPVISGISRKEKTGNTVDAETGTKGSVIQFTVIEKPKFETSEVQGTLKSIKRKNLSSKKKPKKDITDNVKLQVEHLSKEDSDAKGKDVNRIGEIGSNCDSLGGLRVDTSMKDAAMKDAAIDTYPATTGETNDLSPNKLVPWIHSIFSQLDDRDLDKQKQTTENIVNNVYQSPVKTSSDSESYASNVDFTDAPIQFLHALQSSPIKIGLIPSPVPKHPTMRLQPIAPKSSPNPKSVPYVPLPRISPKRKELNRQVRHILPKSFVFETKNPSPTKTTALNLKKRATLLCQKSPVKILPRTSAAPSIGEDRDVKSDGIQSTVLTRSQRERNKTKKKEEAVHKAVKRVKKAEEDPESAKETESEASEVESGLSQEEDDDQLKLNDLMAASTTIRFGSKQHSKVFDDDVKTKAERKKALSLSLLQPDLVQTDPKMDDRDTAFAQQYFNQVKETLSSDPKRFHKFLSLLKDLNKDHTSPVELYLDMVSLLSEHHQLVEDFAGFLLTFQAVECQCFSTTFQYTQIRQFLRQVETHCGSSANTYHKVLKAMSTWSTMCQEGKMDGSLREKMLTILRNVPDVLDNLIGYFLDATVTDCHAMDFEDVCMDDAMEEVDEFENITLPDEREEYNSKTCSCHCHSNPQDERFHRRIKHCISCSLQMYEGQPVLKMSRNEFRPMSIVYPSDESEGKEKFTKVKMEAAQMALAKAKVQKGKKRKKEWMAPKSKVICIDSETNLSNQQNIQGKTNKVEVVSETKAIIKTKDSKKQPKSMGSKSKVVKSENTNKKSKAPSKGDKQASNSKTRNKEDQPSKSDKASKSNNTDSKGDESRPNSIDAVGGADEQVFKSSKIRASGNEKPGLAQSSVEEAVKNCDPVQDIDGIVSEGDHMEVDTSELVDRFILDNISDEGLTEAVLTHIHSQFPKKSMKVIHERALQLLTLLETMSDASTDVEDDTKIL